MTDGMIYGLLVAFGVAVFLTVSRVARVRAARTRKRILKSIE